MGLDPIQPDSVTPNRLRSSARLVFAGLRSLIMHTVNVACFDADPLKWIAFRYSLRQIVAARRIDDQQVDGVPYSTLVSCGAYAAKSG